MQDHRQKSITALVCIALVIATYCIITGSSTALAADNDKPGVASVESGGDAHIQPGWKVFLVGTNKYVNLEAEYDLRYAVNDAEALKARFIELGVPQENITILTTESRGALIPEKKNIEAAYKTFIERLQEGDNAFVYLSGHGFRFEKSKRAYYAPQNVVPDSVAELIESSVSLDDMRTALHNSPATVAWMVVDAPSNEPGQDRDGDSDATSDDVVSKTDAVATNETSNTFIYLQSCEDGLGSLESPDLKHSLMAFALLEALQLDENPVDHSNSGEVQMVEFLGYVQTRTEELAGLCRTFQSPVIACERLKNFTLLTNLRHGGLTAKMRQEIESEEKNFENYLLKFDFDLAQNSLTALAGYYPEGTQSRKYQELDIRLQAVKHRKAWDDAQAQKKKEADVYFDKAREALASEEYALAKTYINEALAHYDTSMYRGTIIRALKTAVDQAVTAGNYQRAKNLNSLLADLDPQAAMANEANVEPPKPESQLQAGDLKSLIIAGVRVNFHWAPAGSFLMGSPESEQRRKTDEKQHEITLTQGFWIAETETTQELWQAVMEDNPSKFNDSNQLPVDSVTWHDCQNFVQKLNRTYNKILPIGYHFAMPTEAQWEYACRAGTTTPFNLGEILNGRKANFDGNHPYGTSQKSPFIAKTTPVKNYAPNAWGLYDMHGNVSEWCADWYDADYNGNSILKDPTGPSDGTQRVLRGGSWYKNGEFCRSAFRINSNPGTRDSNFGFRLVLVRELSVQAPQTQTVTTVQQSSNDAVPDSARHAGDLKTFLIAGVEVNFHWAPAGTFLMGSPESEEGRKAFEKQHEVTLTKGFWIAETETTQGLWKAVTGETPSFFKGSDQLPVENISWNNCREFVQKLNRDYSSVLPSGYKFALPTEAQWEYACRAGTTTPFNFGSTLNGDRANCNGTIPYGTSSKGTHKATTTPVKSYAPNAWGLYDMHGNVAEWTSDWFDSGYYANSSATKDPMGPSSGTTRVMRGGSWIYGAESCRSANRNDCNPEYRLSNCGFRLVLVR